MQLRARKELQRLQRQANELKLLVIRGQIILKRERIIQSKQSQIQILA
jgi:hypothetical protein